MTVDVSSMARLASQVPRTYGFDEWRGGFQDMGENRTLDPWGTPRAADVYTASGRILKESLREKIGEAFADDPAALNEPPDYIPFPSLPALKDGEESRQIMVPDRTVPLIIGRGGETVRAVQKRSGCLVNIFGVSQIVNGLRPVKLIGLPEAIAHARSLIMEIVGWDNKESARSQSKDRGWEGAGGYKISSAGRADEALADELKETVREAIASDLPMEMIERKDSRDLFAKKEMPHSANPLDMKAQQAQGQSNRGPRSVIQGKSLTRESGVRNSSRSCSRLFVTHTISRNATGDNKSRLLAGFGSKRRATLPRLDGSASRNFP